MENKRVLIINGATRVKGNTDIILNRLTEAAQQTDVRIRQIDVRKKKIKDCIGCEQCKENRGCSIKDDMKEVYEEIDRSRLIIFDNLDMTLVDTCLFGNVNEKGVINEKSEYLDQIDQLGKTLSDRLM